MLAFLASYLPTLAVTLGLECLVALVWARSDPRRRILQTCVALNLCTHPLATLVMLHANPPLELLEVTIIGAEYLGYRALMGWRVGRALGLALVANVLSAVVGVVVAW